MKITVLGCSGSMGVPSAGGFWGRCDPDEPRNNRTRASLLVQSQTTSLVVDATYELRLQLNRHPLKRLDGLILSHAHADHINGIEDLRALAYHNNTLIETFSNKETLDELERRAPYAFTTEDIYTAFLKKNVIGNHEKFSVGDIGVESFAQDHGNCTSLGFRFGAFAYSVDVVDLDAKALAALKGVETWIVDGGGYQRDSLTTHANLKRVFNWVDILKPKMTYLTVLTTHMDYKTLCDELPPHIRPAYDGMEIEMGTNLR